MKARIIVIDDRKLIRESVEHVLKNEGHTVVSVESAEQGLAGVEGGDFDIVMTDFQMPGTNGLEIIKKLHDARPRLPVILMTAHHTTDLAIEATRLGAFDYILHPINPPELLELIEKALAASRVPCQGERVESEREVGGIIGKSRVMQNIFK